MYGKKPRDLRKLKKDHSWVNEFDNLNMRIFNVPDDWENMAPLYLRSDSLPEERYGYQTTPLDEIDEETQSSLNTLEGFVGPNEMALANKFFHSPAPLLMMIGGIGTGKSTFARLFANEICHLRCEGCEKAGCLTRRRICVIADYKDLERKSFKKQRIKQDSMSDLPETTWEYDEPTIRDDIINHLIAAVSMEVEGRFFTLEEEVSIVWGRIIDRKRKRRTRRGGVFGLIYSAMHAENAVTYEEGREKTIKIRRRIRKEVLSSSERHLEYLAELLHFIRDEHYGGESGCIIVIVDNIDGKPVFVQQVLQKALRPFFAISEIRGVVVLRAGTYRRMADNAYEQLVDVVPYCGPDPMAIVLHRIKRFLENRQDYVVNSENNERIDDVVAFFRYCQEILTNARLVKEHFSALCGFSIRKALRLAQALLINHEYDPAHLNSVLAYRVVRALVSEGESEYARTERSVVASLFWVQQSSSTPHLLKTRILRFIRQREQEGIAGRPPEANLPDNGSVQLRHPRHHHGHLRDGMAINTAGVERQRYTLQTIHRSAR